MKQNNLIQLFIMLFTITLYTTSTYSQLEISTAGVPFSINFDETRANVNSDIFSANGIDPNPAIGQLDSDAWAITGFSDGNIAFGGSGTGLADYNRGESPFAVGTGGLYAFDVSNDDPKNNALGFQPTGTDFNPGTVTLKVLNGTGLTATSMEIAYEVFVYNDQGRASTLNFSYSLDDVNYTAVPSLDLTTTTTADVSPVWIQNDKSIIITGISVASSANFYLRWSSADAGGSGSRDQIALDDIEVKLFTATWSGSVSNDWDTSGNWENGTIPTSGDDVVVPSGLSRYPTKSGALTINSISLESESSFIADGTVSAVINYKRGLNTTNWYLISSPLSGESVGDIITEHPLAEGTGSNLGLANYDNTELLPENRWNYYTLSSVDAMNSGEGFTVKFTSAQDIRFVGSMVTENVSRAISVGAGDAFNLLGNPYVSYINSADFLSTNSGLLTEQTIWLWNQALNDYETKPAVDAFKIAPAQGFFVEASGSGSVLFEESSQSHQVTPTFQKTSNTRNEIILNVNNGENDKFLKVYYIDEKTKGFDNGFDGKLFGGINYDFAIYSDLLESDGKKYQVQTLPSENYETMVIPIGVVSSSEKELTFSVKEFNLPNNINIYLEDRLTNTITRLDEANSEYKITLSESLDGIGRFYLHTKSSSVLSTDEVILNSVRIFSTDKNTLRIAGLQPGKASVKLFNILGKEVVNTSFVSKGVSDVALPNLVSGIYIVQLETENGNLNKKITLN